MWKKHIFSPEDEQKIIDFVKSHEILFNMNHESFRDAQRKNYLWSKLANGLNKDVDLVKTKWKTMRDYFVRSRGRITNASELSIKRNESLSFLTETQSSLKRSRLAALPHVDKEYYIQSWIDGIRSEALLQPPDSWSNGDAQAFVASPLGAIRSRNDSPASSVQTPLSKRRKASQEEKNDVAKEEEHNDNNDDDGIVETFFEVIMATVQKFSPEAKYRVKQGIRQILADEEENAPSENGERGSGLQAHQNGRESNNP